MRVRSKPPKKIGKGGYYYLWWFVCTNKKCRALYMVEAAKRLGCAPFATLPVSPERDAYDDTPAEAFILPAAVINPPDPKVSAKVAKRRLRKEARKRSSAEKRGRKQRKRDQLPERLVAYREYIDSPEWRAFRMTVFAARGRTCERCGSNEKGIRHVHHVHYRNLFHEKPEDVQVLCVDCHKSAHPGKG